MSRYFIEVAYKGTNYSGFQRQENANTIQAEIEKCLEIIHRSPVLLTGSSRTDAGVHALQNYFHFDYELEIHPQILYKINSILPDDIAVKAIVKMPGNAHSRFDAISRKYEYRIHKSKNPFLKETSLFYPYKLNLNLLNEAAELVKNKSNFFAFSKTNTQVKNFTCTISRSEWIVDNHTLVYRIEGNRFLRGMVRLLTATLLKVGREQLSLHAFEQLFDSEEKCGFSIPPHGLYLFSVCYPDGYFSMCE